MTPFKIISVALFAALLATITGRAQTGVVQTIAPDVYFHQGDHSFVYCNNGWVVFNDYVLVVDANYPGGAKIVIPKIHAVTPKPVRFVIDTHFHPDHSFGNQLWAEEGATPVAHVAALEELKKSGSNAWAFAAKTRPDVAASHLTLPGIVYTDAMIFADAGHRVELHWFGPGHTAGDTLVWLPQEKILFTGDLCVNGSYNYINDSDTAGWIKVLEAAKALGAKIVCPGHGPIGGPEIVVDQQGYLIELRRGVQALVDAKKTPAEVKAAVPALAADLRKIDHIARYVPSDFWFTAHVDKVYRELSGEPLPK
jgi:glyoxylase-like metal-dependent hydrolase (beta-lactamase superfamily II)